MDLVIVSDFDGTIVDIDTAEYVLEKFAKGEWRIYEKQFAKGEITLEECMQRQFSLVKASKRQILKELENIVHFRACFEKLAEYCAKHSFPLVVASAGLDFAIEHFLKLKSCPMHIRIVSPKSQLTPRGNRLLFPKLHDRASCNFKDDLVRNYRKQGKQVVYIGDGTGDAEAARIANYLFTIEGSALANLCTKENIEHKEIKNFIQVIAEIENICKHRSRVCE